MSGAMAAPVIGGIAPSAQTANPLYQGMIQRFQKMGPEQLRQEAIFLGSSPMGQMAQAILHQKEMLPNATPQAPAQGAPAGAAVDPSAQGPAAGGIAAPAASPAAPSQGTPAPSNMGLPYQRGGSLPGFAFGGNPMGIGVGAADPWWTRHEAFAADSGLLHSAIPGRTDHIASTPATGAFVIPADVVSGLGEGNTLAGARVLTEAMMKGPDGTPLPRGGPRFSHGIPRPEPAPGWAMRQMQTESKGGPTKKVPIAAAGGEFIVPPEAVHTIGGGDLERGHRVLHHFVVAARAKIIAEMKKLKEPVKS